VIKSIHLFYVQQEMKTYNMVLVAE